MNRVLIYVGNERSDDPSAVGTHTAGIVQAFKSTGFFSRIIFIGGKTRRTATHTLPADRLYWIDCSGVVRGNGFRRIKSRIEYLVEASRMLIDLIREHRHALVYVYHRYDIIFSAMLLGFSRRAVSRRRVCLLIEYNDIATTQLRFAARFGQWRRLGSMLRTGPAFRMLVRCTERVVVDRSSFMIAITDRIARYLESLSGRKNCLVVPNAASSELVDRARSTDVPTLRLQMGLSPNLFYWAHVGSVTYWDGLEWLLRGLSLSRHGSQIRVIILGQGSALPSLKEEAARLGISGLIDYRGPRPHDEAVRYLLAADAVPLLKTIRSYQLSPIKFYEALAAGKPVLTTDIPYLNEIAGRAFGRVLSFPLSAQRVAQVIDDFFENRHDLAALRGDIMDFVEQNHTWQQRANTILGSVADKTGA